MIMFKMKTRTIIKKYHIDKTCIDLHVETDTNVLNTKSVSIR